MWQQNGEDLPSFFLSGKTINFLCAAVVPLPQPGCLFFVVQSPLQGSTIHLIFPFRPPPTHNQWVGPVGLKKRQQATPFIFLIIAAPSGMATGARRLGSPPFINENSYLAPSRLFACRLVSPAECEIPFSSSTAPFSLGVRLETRRATAPQPLLAGIIIVLICRLVRVRPADSINAAIVTSLP